MLQDILTTFITSMLPISELRGAIPLGIAAFDLKPSLVYVIAVVGNMIPVIFLLWFWEKAAGKLADTYAPIGQLFHWLFERTRKKFYANHKRFGQWALVIFVAIPLPITGAWTGTVAAWLFGIPYKKALNLIFAGVLISGLIVLGITTGIVSIVN